MERKITIAKGKNKLTASVSNAKTVEIIDAKGNVVGRARSDKLTVPQVFYIQDGEHTIVTDGKIEDLNVASEDLQALLEFAQLSLVSDAKDSHAVDGIPEIRADGKSFSTITIRKLDSQGNPLLQTKDSDEVFLRTDAGVIKDADGVKEIRNLKLKKGEGSFRLYSEERKRVATVRVITANPHLADASIQIEFF